MITKEEAESLSDKIKSIWYDYKLKNKSDRFPTLVENKLSLKYIGSGASRYVFKKPRAREVIKVDTSGVFNFSEFALWKALQGTSKEKMLAECRVASSDFVVITQKFYPIRIPNYCNTDSNFSSFLKFSDKLETYFYATHHGDCDFNTDNIKVDRDGNLKIIDYAAVSLEHSKYKKKFDLPSFVRKLKRYNTSVKKEVVSFHLGLKNELVLVGDTETIKTTYEHANNTSSIGTGN